MAIYGSGCMNMDDACTSRLSYQLTLPIQYIGVFLVLCFFILLLVIWDLVMRTFVSAPCLYEKMSRFYPLEESSEL